MSSKENLLKQLAEELAAKKAEVKEMRSHLGEEEARLETLVALVDNLRSYLGKEELDEGENRPVPRVQTNELVEDPAAPKRRVRSTEMVADLVKDYGQPMTRSQIFEKFMEKHSQDVSWKNPQNALNNAIFRAVHNNVLVEHKDGRFSGP